MVQQLLRSCRPHRHSLCIAIVTLNFDSVFLVHLETTTAKAVPLGARQQRRAERLRARCTQRQWQRRTRVRRTRRLHHR
ncbi:hypothetical protein U9M48_015790 [Paspalum notatum var. saurae]|uniref:Uncharacterized protein n=1 Tax=Paspalum notatum var. saurae TaxID=547442 RepID=A0AAQ3WM99_PASNO